jgi:hypothetical protein
MLKLLTSGNLGFFGVVLLILDFYALFHIFQSNREPFNKALWTAVVVFMPFVGLLIWGFAGPRASR